MRRSSRSAVAVLAVVLLAVALGQGCGSSTSTQYHTLATVKIGVDTAMNVWADRVIDGKATPAQESRVKAAFKAYQDAFAVAIHAAVNDQAPPTALVTQTAGDLLSLLSSLGVKTGGTQ